MGALSERGSALKNASLSLAAILLVGAGVVYVVMRSDGPDSAAAAPRVPGSEGESATLVVVEPVGERTFTDVIEALGTGEANESVTLTAKLTDTVSKVSFDDGDFAIVLAHDPLAAEDGHRDRRVVVDGDEIDERVGFFRRCVETGHVNHVVHAHAQAFEFADRFRVVGHFRKRGIVEC